jgi:Ca2+-binding EF-hand superfamily protein
MEKRMDQRGDHRFEALDANKDGVITKAEAAPVFAKIAAAHSNRPAPSWDKLAARLDSNKDGKITRAEFDAAQEKRDEHMAERNAKGGMHTAGFGRMFGMADLNKDGRVTLKEATQVALQHFDAADANHDGTLTPEERHAAHPKGAGQTTRS